jgi:hypothetical protein
MHSSWKSDSQTVWKFFVKREGIIRDFVKSRNEKVGVGGIKFVGQESCGEEMGIRMFWIIGRRFLA